MIRIAVLILLTAFSAYGAEKKAVPRSTPSQKPSDVSTADDDGDDDDDGSTPTQKVSKDGDTVSSDDSNDDSDDDSDDTDDESDDEANGKALSGNVTLASDYILRGLSQTDHQPALQGGFDWEHPSGFALGLWGSNVHFQDATSSLELDAYGNYTYHFQKDLSTNLGLLYYSYWIDTGRDGWVIPCKTQWKTYSLELDYSPNWQGQGTTSWYLLAGWQDKVIWDVKLGAYAGVSLYSTDNNTPDYADFIATASREYFGVEWSVSGVFTSRTLVNDAEGGARLVLAMTKAF